MMLYKNSLNKRKESDFAALFSLIEGANAIFSSKSAMQTAQEIAQRGGTPQQVLLGTSTSFPTDAVTSAVPLGQPGKLTGAAGLMEQRYKDRKSPLPLTG